MEWGCILGAWVRGGDRHGHRAWCLVNGLGAVTDLSNRAWRMGWEQWQAWAQGLAHGSGAWLMLTATGTGLGARCRAAVCSRVRVLD